MQVDGDVEPFLPQAARQRKVVAHSGEATSSRDDNDVSQITITANNLCRCRFDDIGEPGSRVPPAKGTNQRRRQHDVANQPQSD